MCKGSKSKFNSLTITSSSKKYILFSKFWLESKKDVNIGTKCHICDKVNSVEYIVSQRK